VAEHEPEPEQVPTDEPERTPAEPQAPTKRARLGQSGPAQYMGTGKRKTSVARVILRPGDGATWFNGRAIEDYFPRLAHRAAALAPLKTAGAEGTYDIRVRVHGGGPTGQAGAGRHGIARALVEADPNLRVALKREGYLTRDAREVERKKAGLHKARKAPQFSKR
jgi:small subunit ribosomal protein S9